MEGQREINELHVPVDQPVKITLASEDVIHSFYIPAFRIKHDVVPSHYDTMWFQATKPGRYHIFCAEYCGTGWHSGMIGWVHVMQPDQTRVGQRQGLRMMAAGPQRLKYQVHRLPQRRQPGQGLAGGAVPEDGAAVVRSQRYATKDDIRRSICDPEGRHRRSVLADHADVRPDDMERGKRREDLVAFIVTLGDEERLAANEAMLAWKDKGGNEKQVDGETEELFRVSRDAER